MFLFLILLLPCCIAISCFQSRSAAQRTAALSGFVTGVIITTLSTGISFMHRITEYDIFPNLLYFSAREYALPAIILYTTYCISSKRNETDKTKAFFPLCASFYAVYMPYCIIAAKAFYFFTLFIKPLLFLALLLHTAHLVYRIRFGTPLTALPKLMLLAAAALTPAYLATLWLLHTFLPAAYAASGMYILSALALFGSALTQRTSFLS